MAEKILWHNLPIREVVKLLYSNPQRGLSLEDVEKRQVKFGKNVLPQHKPPSNFEIFLYQLKSPLPLILLVSGIITLLFGKFTDSFVIFLAVLVNSFFGFFEEKKASKTLEGLKKILKTQATVLRGGHKMRVLEKELVPGDIIFLQAGDKVPADGRLIEAENLKVSEAILTGEWLASLKSLGVLPKETPLADRENMVYQGSLVESGEGKAVVVATGKKTEGGKIAQLLKSTPYQKTPLQRKLANFGKILGILIGFVCLLIFVGGILRGGEVLNMFEAAVAVAVGGVPEALPVVMTVVLAIGVERLLKRKGLVKRLSSVETLGSTSVICFDKTKTLTKGEMEVCEVISCEEDLCLKVAVLCSEAFVENPELPPKEWKIIGSSTDKAILKAGSERNILKPKLERKSIELFKVPFSSLYKFKLSLRKENGRFLFYIVGAPEKVLERSKFFKDNRNWSEEVNKMAQKGLRVIGVGYKEIGYQAFMDIDRMLKEDSGNGRIEKLISLAQGFTFAGLIGLNDPLRPEIKEALKICFGAGMKPIIITGDHLQTAKAVASEIGMKLKEEECVTADTIDGISDEGLEKFVSKIKIIARAEPRHKLRIISAWQGKGETVAMVGDGVNDAPALKKADIGVALGSGTEVAKEASDLIILDDSFSTMVKAVEQGRIVLDNIRKSISYVLADAFTAVILIGFGKVLFGWPLPILPVQILWNNFIEDSLPTISYAFEPKEKGLMKRKPVSKKASLLTKEMKILIFATGLIDEFITLGLFWILWRVLGLDLGYVRTMVFGSVCLDTAFVVYCYRNLKKNIWHINPFSNKYLNMSSAMVFVTFSLAIYLPFFQRILHTVPLGIGSWLILVLIGFASMFLIEATKWYFISRHKV